MSASVQPRPSAVVVGLDSSTGLQTARVLAGRGIPVVGIASQRRHPSCYTRACRRIVFTNTSTDELIFALRRLGRTFDERPVLFPCSDLSVLLLSRHREELAPAFRTVLPAPGVIERLIDKAGFHELAVERGWPIAATHVLRDRADAVRAAATLTFPCVVKPAVKTVSWHAHTSTKVFPVASGAELLACYERCSGWANPLVVQEWVEGPDVAHFTCNAYFDADANPVLTFVSQKLRQWPLEGGVGCLSQECRNQTVLEETVRVFRSVGHHGLAYLEMKRDPRTGAYLIIEPNVGRPTGRSAAADAAGVELLYAQYCDAVGLPLPPPRQQPYTTAKKWIYFRRDLQAAVAHWRRGTLTASEWMQSLRGCRTDAVFSWRDPVPFVADLQSAVGKAFGRLGLPSGAPRLPGRATPAKTAAADVMVGSAREVIDYDLHGIVGLRLLGASAGDAAAVARQLGAPGAPLCREPDLVLRFVDDLPLSALQWVEYGRTGFARDGLYVLESGKQPVRMRIPFERLGTDCDIVCQRGVASAPLLMPLLNLTAFARGYLPLHAAACVYQGRGVLLPAWANGGKTTGLLALIERGAEYVADEWVWLAPDGTRMYGIPGMMTLRAGHVPGSSVIRTAVPSTTRVLWRAVRRLEWRHARGGRAASLLGTLSRVERRAVRALRRRLDVEIDPARVFGRRGTAQPCAPDHVFLMMRSERPGVEVTAIDPATAAARIAAATAHEWLGLIACYLAHCYAFPERPNALLSTRQLPPTDAYARALAGRRAFVVCHPDACDPKELLDVMTSACSAEPVPAQCERRGYEEHAAGICNERIEAIPVWDTTASAHDGEDTPMRAALVD